VPSRRAKGVHLLVLFLLLGCRLAAEKGLVVTLRAVPGEAGGRLVLQADRPFGYRVRAVAEGIEIACDRPIRRLEMEPANAPGSPVSAAGLNNLGHTGTIRVSLTPPRRPAGHLGAHPPLPAAGGPGRPGPGGKS
jgi:hypothetical protein